LLLEVEQTYAQFSNKGTRLIHTVRVDLSLPRNAGIPLCHRRYRGIGLWRLWSDI